VAAFSAPYSKVVAVSTSQPARASRVHSIVEVSGSSSTQRTRPA